MSFITHLNSRFLQANWHDGADPVYHLLWKALLLMCAILFPLLSFDFGITWDEWTHVEYGEDILDYFLSFGENRAVFDLSKHSRSAHLLYGASFDTLAALLQKVSPLGIYETRHLLISLMAVGILFFTGKLASLFLHFRLALISTFFLVVSPRFFGHSMNNPKDIPFMLGYVAGCYFLFRALSTLPKPSVKSLLGLTFSVAFTISIKIGGLILVGYLGLFGLLYWAVEWKNQGRATALGRLPKYVFLLVLVAAGGFLLGILCWLYALQNPIAHPYQALTEFQNFSLLISYELFEGKRIFMEQPPWHYTFKWMLITVPILVITGLFAAVLPPFHLKDRPTKLLFAGLLFTFLFPILYTIAKGSTLYSGWRHLMFVYSPVVILSAFGWEQLAGLVMQRKLVIRLLLVTALLLAFRPIQWMWLNHPNQYVYFNELTGGVKGAYGRYETDYWCNSMKAATAWFLAHEYNGTDTLTIATNFEPRTAAYFARQFQGKIRFQWVKEGTYYQQPWDYAFFGTRTMTPRQIEHAFPPKGTLHAITADGAPLLAIVKAQHHILLQMHFLMEQERFEEALELAPTLMQQDPTNPEVLHNLGLLYLNLNQPTIALELLNNALQLYPDDFMLHTICGMAHYKLNQFKQAEFSLRQGIALKINNTTAYHKLGMVYLKTGIFEAAKNELEKAARYDKFTNALIVHDLALAWMNMANQPGQQPLHCARNAEKYFLKALELDPQIKSAYQNLIYLYQHTNEPKKEQFFREKLSALEL